MSGNDWEYAPSRVIFPLALSGNVDNEFIIEHENGNIKGIGNEAIRIGTAAKKIVGTFPAGNVLGMTRG